MVYASARIEEMLGLGDDIATRFRIAEAIMDCLEDLLAMKPMKVEKEASTEISGVMRIGDEVFEVGFDAEPGLVNSTDGMDKVEQPLELARGDI